MLDLSINHVKVKMDDGIYNNFVWKIELNVILKMSSNVGLISFKLSKEAKWISPDDFLHAI